MADCTATRMKVEGNSITFPSDDFGPVRSGGKSWIVYVITVSAMDCSWYLNLIALRQRPPWQLVSKVPASAARSHIFLHMEGPPQPSSSVSSLTHGQRPVRWDRGSGSISARNVAYPYLSIHPKHLSCLPAAAKRTVKLHEGKRFTLLRADQVQLGGKEV